MLQWIWTCRRSRSRCARTVHPDGNKSPWLDEFSIGQSSEHSRKVSFLFPYPPTTSIYFLFFLTSKLTRLVTQYTQLYSLFKNFDFWRYCGDDGSTAYMLSFLKTYLYMYLCTRFLKHFNQEKKETKHFSLDRHRERDRESYIAAVNRKRVPFL